MRRALFLLTAASLLHAQESGKVTIDKKARFSELVQVLEAAASCRIPIDKGVEDKVISVSIRGAGFFQILDALCRSQGNVTYFDPDESRRGDREEFSLFPGPWVEYPSAYSGTFKVVVPAMNRFRSRSVDGEQSWTCVHLILLAPPTLSVDWRSGAGATWTLQEANDAGGATVTSKGPEPREQISIARSQFPGGNVAYTSLALKDFDLDRGLSLLKGEVTLTIADSKEVRIALEPGKETDIPGGKIVVDGVREHEKDSWRIALTFQPSGPITDLNKLLENRVQYDGSGWDYLGLPHGGRSFEIDAFRAGQKPTWVKLRVRGGERKMNVPFELKDVRFKQE